jgi:hypothetical protein
MSNSCPGCGADVAFPARPAVLLQGKCAECGKVSMVIEEGAAMPPASGDAAPAGPMVACPQCGEGLTVLLTADGAIDTSCAGCGAQLRYLPESRMPREAPPRGPMRVRADTGGGDFGRPSTRPCRECGGPLRFSSGPDGLTVGECGSCGNRFTLPPRPDGGDRGDRGDRGRRPYDRGGGGRSFPPGRGRPGSYGGRDDRRGPPRYGGGGGRFVRRGPPRDDDREDRDDPRRRRRKPGTTRE